MEELKYFSDTALLPKTFSAEAALPPAARPAADRGSGGWFITILPEHRRKQDRKAAAKQWC